MTDVAGNSTGGFLLGLVPTGTDARTFFSTYVLNATDETALLAGAREDARRYVYNAVVSFLGGLAGLYMQQMSWAVTKLYYTGFYIGRASLCRGGRIIFHVPKGTGGSFTQCEITARAGERAVICRGSSTHKLVAQRFREAGYPVFMQGLTIDGVDPLLWLMDQRELWQYRAARFCDPDCPSVLDQIDPEKLQQLLAAYASDTTGVYLADPAHAVVSVPFRLVTWALLNDALGSPGVVNTEDLMYLRRCCRIGRQKLVAVERHLN